MAAGARSSQRRRAVDLLKTTGKQRTKALHLSLPFPGDRKRCRVSRPPRLVNPRYALCCGRCFCRRLVCLIVAGSSIEEKESAGAAEEVDAIIGELETLKRG